MEPLRILCGRRQGVPYSIWLHKKLPAYLCNMRGRLCSDVLDDDLLRSGRVHSLGSGYIVFGLVGHGLISMLCLIHHGVD
jgi:hypothetical protein